MMEAAVVRESMNIHTFLRYLMRINNWSISLLFLLVVTLPDPGVAALENFTYRLSQSSPQLQLWTTLPSEKVFKNDAVPEESSDGITVYAAKNETEPFLVVAKSVASTVVEVTMGAFGAEITTELYQVKYVNIGTTTDYLGIPGDNPDPLLPIASGDSVSCLANQNSAFWVSIRVPEDAPAGDYVTNITIGGIAIPVTLHVFNFALPRELHVKSQMNFDYNTVLNVYGVPIAGEGYWEYVDKIKQFFIDHRLTPKSVLWPGGLTSASSTNGTAYPFIDYECNTETLTDNDGIWGFEDLAARYLGGTGLLGNQFSDIFNAGTGFPAFMVATFYNNDPSLDQRRSSFCGITRSVSDWLDNPNSLYNTKWFDYIKVLQDYLDSQGYLDKAYYYIANEPQNQADYEAVAWYSRYLKAAAPELKLMVSEEPKQEIYDHADYLQSGQIDIWLAHLGLHFDPEISGERLKNHGEESWIYFLRGTYLPRYNPITIDHPGVEGKLLGWFLWKFRLRGLAYYQFNNWSSNPWTSGINPNGQNGETFLIYPPSSSGTGAIAYGANGHRLVPSIRLELIRDGLEDYEYFYLLNGSNQPQPEQLNSSDLQVDKIISTAIAYNRDSRLLYNIRKQLGQKIGGEIIEIDDLVPQSVHPRSDETPGNYYINFQDPAGEPVDSPLVVGGKTYLKIGTGVYSATDGYGWYRAADVPASGFYGNWDQWIDPEPKELLGSSIINSWGREDVFEFDLPNGTYNVTVCAGSRSNSRTHNIVIEKETFIDREVTNNQWITRTKEVTVQDKKLTLQMGMFDEISYINYLEIEAVEPRTPDLEDAVIILKTLAGETVPGASVEHLDFTGDSKIGTEDVLSVLKDLSL